MSTDAPDGSRATATPACCSKAAAGWRQQSAVILRKGKLKFSQNDWSRRSWSSSNSLMQSDPSSVTAILRSMWTTVSILHAGTATCCSRDVVHQIRWRWRNLCFVFVLLRTDACSFFTESVRGTFALAAAPASPSFLSALRVLHKARRLQL